MSFVGLRSGSAGEVLQVALRFGGVWSGKVRQARWVQLGNVPVRLRYGRLGMAIKVRCGVVSYNLKFLP